MNPQNPQAGTQTQPGNPGDPQADQANQGGTGTAGKNDPRSDASTRPAGKTQDRQDTTDPTQKKDSTGSDANGPNQDGQNVVPNRSPRARKAPAPRKGRERPGTRRAQTSPKTRRPSNSPVNGERPGHPGREQDERVRRAERQGCRQPALAWRGPIQDESGNAGIPAQGDQQASVTRPTPRRATISRTTRPTSRAAAPRIKIPPCKARNKAGASRPTRKELPGRTSPGRPGLTNRPVVRRNPGQTRKTRVLATTRRPARIPLSRVPPRKEMAVRRLRVSRTPRMRRTLRHREPTAPKPASRPVKTTSPRAAQCPGRRARVGFRLRNPMASPTARTPAQGNPKP